MLGRNGLDLVGSAIVKIDHLRCKCWEREQMFVVEEAAITASVEDARLLVGTSYSAQPMAIPRFCAVRGVSPR